MKGAQRRRNVLFQRLNDQGRGDRAGKHRKVAERLSAGREDRRRDTKQPNTNQMMRPPGQMTSCRRKEPVSLDKGDKSIRPNWQFMWV